MQATAGGRVWTWTSPSGIIAARASGGYIARRDIQRDGSGIEFCLIHVGQLTTFGVSEESC